MRIKNKDRVSCPWCKTFSTVDELSVTIGANISADQYQKNYRCTSCFRVLVCDTDGNGNLVIRHGVSLQIASASDDASDVLVANGKCLVCGGGLIYNEDKVAFCSKGCGTRV